MLLEDREQNNVLTLSQQSPVFNGYETVFLYKKTTTITLSPECEWLIV